MSIYLILIIILSVFIFSSIFSRLIKLLEDIYNILIKIESWEFLRDIDDKLENIHHELERIQCDVEIMKNVKIDEIVKKDELLNR